MQDGEVADLRGGVAAALGGAADDPHKVGVAALGEAGLHGLDVVHVEHGVAGGEGRLAQGRHRASGAHVHVIGEVPVGDDLGLQEQVLVVSTAQEDGAAARRQGVHERDAGVSVVDEVAVAVPPGQEHGLEVGVVTHEAAGDTQGGDGGAAALGEVQGPGVLGADELLNLDARDHQRPLFVLFRDGEHTVDLGGIDAGGV